MPHHPCLEPSPSRGFEQFVNHVPLMSSRARHLGSWCGQARTQIPRRFRSSEWQMISLSAVRL